jgi:hypothetical protein
VFAGHGGAIFKAHLSLKLVQVPCDPVHNGCAGVGGKSLR